MPAGNTCSLADKRSACPPFRPSLVTSPKRVLVHCWANPLLVCLMRPQIVFEILPLLPRSPLLSLVLPPSSGARAPLFARQAPELATNEVALDLSELLRFFHTNDFSEQSRTHLKAFVQQPLRTRK